MRTGAKWTVAWLDLPLLTCVINGEPRANTKSAITFTSLFPGHWWSGLREASLPSSLSSFSFLPSGNPRPERCTVITRIAETFIRFGSFEIFKGTDETTGRSGPSPGNRALLFRMIDYVNRFFYRDIWRAHGGDEAPPAGSPEARPRVQGEGLHAERLDAFLHRRSTLQAMMVVDLCPCGSDVRGGGASHGGDGGAVAAGGLVPWRAEHGQHVDHGSDHRLRALRLHGPLRPGVHLQPLGRRRTLFLPQSAAHVSLELWQALRHVAPCPPGGNGPRRHPQAVLRSHVQRPLPTRIAPQGARKNRNWEMADGFLQSDFSHSSVSCSWGW